MIRNDDQNLWQPQITDLLSSLGLFVSFCMMEIKNFTKDFEKHGAIDWRQGLKFEKLYLTVYKNWRKFWQGHNTLSINPINKF